MTAYKQSVGGHVQEIYTRVFATDFNTAWQAVLDSLKSNRLDVSNRESGLIETRWTENTAEKNFTDGDGAMTLYMKAQYRIRVNVSKGIFQGRPAIKVSIQREQLVERDVLDDWKEIDSNAIEENTLLYRIGRIISIRDRLARLEEKRLKKEMSETNLGAELTTDPDTESKPDTGSSGDEKLDSAP